MAYVNPAVRQNLPEDLSKRIQSIGPNVDEIITSVELVTHVPIVYIMIKAEDAHYELRGSPENIANAIEMLRVYLDLDPHDSSESPDPEEMAANRPVSNPSLSPAFLTGASSICAPSASSSSTLTTIAAPQPMYPLPAMPAQASAAPPIIGSSATTISSSCSSSTGAPVASASACRSSPSPTGELVGHLIGGLTDEDLTAIAPYLEALNTLLDSDLSADQAAARLPLHQHAVQCLEILALNIRKEHPNNQLSANSQRALNLIFNLMQRLNAENSTLIETSMLIHALSRSSR